MTLTKHLIDGLEAFKRSTVSAAIFEQSMKAAGYEITGSAPGQLGRLKVWWIHKTFRRVESVYSPDKSTVITAYHPGN